MLLLRWPGYGSQARRQIWVEFVVETRWNFVSTNQKHYQDLGSDASSVWNFCARYSDVVLRGLKWRPRETSAVISGYGFPLSSKTNISKFQFDLDTVDKESPCGCATADYHLFILFYDLFIYFI